METSKEDQQFHNDFTQMKACAVMGVNYYRSKRWQVYNLSIAPGVFYHFQFDISSIQAIVRNHDLVCQYMDNLIEEHGINSEPYKQCWYEDFAQISWLKYFEVLEQARKWQYDKEDHTPPGTVFN